MSARLIAITSPRVAGVKSAEQLIAYAARVSAPQNHASAPQLLKYCLAHGHYSVFETASMTLNCTSGSVTNSRNCTRSRWSCTRKLSRKVLQKSPRVLCFHWLLRRHYVTGDVRSWIFYIKLRSQNGTQHEHAGIAYVCSRFLKKNFPLFPKLLDGK